MYFFIPLTRQKGALLTDCHSDAGCPAIPISFPFPVAAADPPGEPVAMGAALTAAVLLSPCLLAAAAAAAAALLLPLPPPGLPPTVPPVATDGPEEALTAWQTREAVANRTKIINSYHTFDWAAVC